MSSTSSKSSKKLKKKKSIVVVEEKPKSSFLSYYFCCFCILPKRSRKQKRKLERERLERPNSVETDDDEESKEESVAPDASKQSAAVKIQSLVRGIQTRALMTEYWKEALEEANAHWLKIVRARELAWLIEERKLVARKQVSQSTV